MSVGKPRAPIGSTDASPAVGGTSQRKASGNALTLPLHGFSALPCAGCGHHPPGRSPSPRAPFAPAARSLPLGGCNRVVSAKPAAATGRAGQGQLSLGVCWYLIHMGTWICASTFPRQASVLSLSFSQGPCPWCPLRAWVQEWVPAETRAPAPCHPVGPRGECLRENLALPLVPETEEGSTGARNSAPKEGRQ